MLTIFLRNTYFSFFICFTVGCSTVPLSNRTQFNLVSDEKILNLSEQQYRKVLNESPLSKNPTQIAAVNRVGRRIAAAVDQFFRQQGTPNHYRWEFNVIESKDANAWCMPGGKIAFFTGLFNYIESDADIATVMGHEIAHAIAKHANERMSRQLVSQLGLTILSSATGIDPTLAGNAVMYGILMPYGRFQESEADHIGLILMAMAGYDPRSAIPFWQRMSQGKNQKVPELLSTHPSDATRITNINKHMAEALTYYQSP